MRGKKAKAIRKAVYGADHSTRHREYHILSNGSVIADGTRRLYKKTKKG